MNVFFDWFSYALGLATPFIILGAGGVLAVGIVAWKNIRKSKTNGSLSLLQK